MTMTGEGPAQVLGACPHDCPDTCSMVVTVEDGRVDEGSGNPDHPFTRGGLCVKVTDFPNHIYAAGPRPARRCGGSGRRERAGSSRSRGTTPSTRSPSATGRSSPSTAPEAILPYSYLGNMGHPQRPHSRRPLLQRPRHVASPSARSATAAASPPTS